MESARKPTDLTLDARPSPADPRVTRSRITNGRRMVLFGDGRSSGARRYIDLCEAFAGEVGGFSALPASGQQVVKRLAQVSVELELLEADRAAGKAINAEDFVRLVNSQRRLLRDLARFNRPKTNPLTEHLTKKYGLRSDQLK